LRRAGLVSFKETPSREGACVGCVGGSFLFEKIIINVTTVVLARVEKFLR
jgi:hypothetical protein